MANQLVMLLSDDDGYEYEEKYWHIIDWNGSDPATFCTNEYFGEGQSACEFKVKVVERGGITCPKCLEKLRDIKSIKL